MKSTNFYLTVTTDADLLREKSDLGLKTNPNISWCNSTRLDDNHRSVLDSFVKQSNSYFLPGDKRICSVRGFSREEPSNPERFGNLEISKNLSSDPSLITLKSDMSLITLKSTTVRFDERHPGWIEMIKVETSQGVWGPFGDSGTYFMPTTNW